MRTRSDGPAGVMQKEREGKNKWVREFLEDRPVGAQLRVFCLHHLVELVDANQGVLISSVAMKKFMLHQAGELTELRNVTTEKIAPMHHAQNAADLAFARNDPAKNLARSFATAERPRNQAEIS